MRRKQNAQHLDQRQILVLENAYYQVCHRNLILLSYTDPIGMQCNPPERAPRQTKERSTMEQFIIHLVYDVLAKKTIDKVLRLIRKLDWEDPEASCSTSISFTASNDRLFIRSRECYAASSPSHGS